MKLDYELLKSILQDTEDMPAGELITGYSYEGRNQMEVNEHALLLIDEGFLDGKVHTDGQ